MVGCDYVDLDAKALHHLVHPHRPARLAGPTRGHGVLPEHEHIDPHRLSSKASAAPWMPTPTMMTSARTVIALPP
jgi:hypothetical protein